MTSKDLNILNLLLKRVDGLADIRHLRARPWHYQLTSEDKQLLQDTYQKLDDILKELAAFINVKFPGRQDYIHAWNAIDFNTKMAGVRIVTNDSELIKSTWNNGLFDLKSLIKCLLNEVCLIVDDEGEVKALFEKSNWNKYYDARLEKRVNQADFFIDLIVEKRLINLDKLTVRKYFKKWFQATQSTDLQIKNGDFALEDGDIQFVPDFNKDNIPEFVNWFRKESNSFIDFLKEQGVDVKGKEESTWTKTEIIIAFVSCVVGIISLIWTIWG